MDSILIHSSLATLVATLYDTRLYLSERSTEVLELYNELYGSASANTPTITRTVVLSDSPVCFRTLCTPWVSTTGERTIGVDTEGVGVPLLDTGGATVDTVPGEFGAAGPIVGEVMFFFVSYNLCTGTRVTFVLHFTVHFVGLPGLWVDILFRVFVPLFTVQTCSIGDSDDNGWVAVPAGCGGA